ncbi:MAG: tripartite tricarboxylate transporter TctB family protein [Planctomycetota bacterium]|jgi:putative tricarboxylic transport membrane protein|nr:tripartite tricarboxylate transporter TctB family protein [Planctomycetota bacterium]
MTFGKRFDALTGAGLLGLAGYVYWEGSSMPQAAKGLGPGGYPVFIAVGMAILAVIRIVQALVRYVRDKNAAPTLTLSRGAFFRVLWFLALVFAYLALLPHAGFIPASIALLVYLTHFYGYRRLWANVLVNVVFTISIYLLFRHFFLVLLPTGGLFG